MKTYDITKLIAELKSDNAYTTETFSLLLVFVSSPIVVLFIQCVSKKPDRYD